MNFKRLLNTPLGVMFISILLGLGIATLFRKVCNDRNCIVFNGPIISEFEGKTYNHGEKCFQYSLVSDTCHPTKRIIDIGEPVEPDTTY
jgi:hypothetical protein